MSGSAEILFPFPGTELDRSMRLSTFLDAGQVFQSSEKISFTDLRYSYGISFSWISPVGPLKLSYAFPLKVKEGDVTQRAQFQLGTVF